jgi:hypothetical protein
MAETDPVSAALQDWAEREVTPWRQRGIRRMATEQALHALANRRTDLRLYRFAEGVVTLQPPRPGQARKPSQDFRAELYLRLFRAALPLLPLDFTTTICVGMEDRVLPPFDLPIFGFQRARHEPTPLLPDIDMMIHDHFEGEHFRDDLDFAAKAPRAVFAGSTTGRIFNLQDAQSFAVPRLRAAKFFEHAQDVDFRLPAITQCSDEARAFLETQSFCQAERLNWHEQFKSKFLLSIDGNGATCSRVAVALASRCVLVKYESAHILYYFPALVPGQHYVPVAEDADVLAVIAAERDAPGRFAPVAAAANIFVATYLTRARILEYTARLVVAYARSLREGSGEVSFVPARRAVCSAKTVRGAVLQEDGEGWAGKPGSGEKLAGFMAITRPPGATFRLMYHAMLDNGRFVPIAREGKWCMAEDDGAGLAAITIEFPRAAPPTPFLLEARFTDGSTASCGWAGGACRAVSGAAIEAFRVRVT